jgi:hypothetical protein
MTARIRSPPNCSTRVSFVFPSKLLCTHHTGVLQVLTNQCGVRQLDKQSGGTLSLDFVTTAPWVTLNGTVTRSSAS